MQQVKQPRGDNRRIRYLSENEAERLLNALAQRSRDVHDMALLALYCGLRAGEILSLSWNDVNFEHGLVTIRNPKNDRTRHLPMPNRVQEMLREREMDRKIDSNLIFPARNGGRRQSVGHTFDRTVAALGLNNGIEDRRQRVVFHTLRHTFASWLVMAGTPLYSVQHLLGHQSIALTERYSHLAPDSLQQAMQVLNQKGDKDQDQEGKVINLQSTK